MAKFIEKEVMDMADFDEYCHYVAGLVGIGLSNLWGVSKMESAEFVGEEKLSTPWDCFYRRRTSFAITWKTFRSFPRRECSG